MLPSWDEARAAYEAGRLGGPDLACVYVAERVQRVAGRSWLQGPRRPALRVPEGGSELLGLFATREMHAMPPAVGQALVAWAAGQRRVEVWFSIPTPRALLAMQAEGRRVVSLLDDAVAPSRPKAAYGGHGASPGLGFVVHDLCHLEKFAEPAHHVGQVGFFAALHRALADERFAAVERGFDAAWIDERDHVLADMNGSPVFLFVVLRNKAKLAVRRRVAAERGAPIGRGPLDPDEQRAYDEATERLLDALGLDQPSREAAFQLDSKRGADAAAADVLEAAFVRMGSEVLARA